MILRRVTIACGLVAVILLAGRFFMLEADVPPWFAPGDLALHLDDGVKTLSARNYVEFGQTHWNQNDTYVGWEHASPLTQGLYVLAYTVGGVQVASVRIVGVLFFITMIAAFVFTFRGVYAPWVISSGAVLLLLEPMLFHFSRVALFEMPLSLMVAVGAFAVFRTRDRGALVQVALLVFVAAAGSRLVKPSGYVYLAPAMAALLLRGMIKQNLSRVRWIFTWAIAGLVLAFVLYQMRGMWIMRIYVEDPAWIPQRLLTSGLQELSPLYVGAALLCLVHGLATRAEDYLDDSYRVVLLSVLLGVPLVLTLFVTSPAHYYVAIMPAAALLVIDHFGRGLYAWRSGQPPARWARISVAVVAVLLAWYLFRGIDYALLRRLDMPIGDSPGILAITMYRLFPPVAAVVFLGGFIFTKQVARTNLFQILIGVLLVAILGLGVAEQAHTLMSPTFDSQRIRDELVGLVDEDESVAGDWAVFFTLGTGRRSLYVTHWCNSPDIFPTLRPDYFLCSQSRYDAVSLPLLKSHPMIHVGEPDLLGTMLGHEIRLYPLIYSEGPDGEER